MIYISLINILLIYSLSYVNKFIKDYGDNMVLKIICKKIILSIQDIILRRNKYSPLMRRWLSLLILTHHDWSYTALNSVKPFLSRRIDIHISKCFR